MSIVHKVCVGAAAWLAGAGAGGAQGVIMERNVSLLMARAIADGAIEHCAKDGRGVSVAVVDRAGQVRVLLRGDATPPHSPELARRKAYTARTFRRTSSEWAKRSETGLAGQRSLDEVIPLGGGVPIMVGDDAIGAVGVSGASGGQEADEACAKAGIAKVADRLR